MPDTFREAKKIRSDQIEEKGTSFSPRTRGVSRRRIGAASCSQSRAGQHIPEPTGDRENRPRAVAVVVLPVGGGRFGRRLPPLAPGAPTSATPPRAGVQNLPARRGHERAPRSRTFHSPPDQSRSTERKSCLVFSAAAPRG